MRRRLLTAAIIGLTAAGCAGSVQLAGTPLPEPTAVLPEPTAVLREPTAVIAPTAAAVIAEPTMTVAPTATSTAEPEATPTATPTSEPTPTVAPTATVLPTPTNEPEPTAVPESTSEPAAKPDLESTGYDGPVRALRTSRGVVVAVRGIDADGYQIVTPCYNVATISDGLELRGPIDVLIDPGHGGAEESGAVGPNGLIEATVNLQVAELLRDLLVELGYSVAMTRYSDHRVSIQSRAAIANALAPRVFMSIHHNGGFPEPFPVAGTEVFVQLDDPDSARLGGLVFEEIQEAFADIDADWMGNEESFGVAWRMNDEGTDLYGVLRRTPDLVSVLTEAMFLSTEAEAELLAMPEILDAEALALANALNRFFETDDPGSGFIEGIVFEGDLGNGGGTEGCVDPPLS